MTYTGHVRNGAIVLDEPADLAEGTAVTVQVDEAVATRAVREKSLPTLRDAFGEFIGVVEDKPADWSIEHDKYLRDEYLKS